LITYWTAIGIAVALWFATGWYLNERLKIVHTKLDLVLDNFNGLREYLYEIDPQFDEERRLLTDLYSDGPGTLFAGKQHMDLTNEKKENGFRTLNSPFYEGGFRAPNN
jgi:hypothetical protein